MRYGAFIYIIINQNYTLLSRTDDSGSKFIRIKDLTVEENALSWNRIGFYLQVDFFHYYCQIFYCIFYSIHALVQGITFQ